MNTFANELACYRYDRIYVNRPAVNAATNCPTQKSVLITMCGEIEVLH